MRGVPPGPHTHVPPPRDAVCQFSPSPLPRPSPLPTSPPLMQAVTALLPPSLPPAALGAAAAMVHRAALAGSAGRLMTLVPVEVRRQLGQQLLNVEGLARAALRAYQLQQQQGQPQLQQQAVFGAGTLTRAQQPEAAEAVTEAVSELEGLSAGLSALCEPSSSSRPNKVAATAAPPHGVKACVAALVAHFTARASALGSASVTSSQLGGGSGNGIGVRETIVTGLKQEEDTVVIHTSVDPHTSVEPLQELLSGRRLDSLAVSCISRAVAEALLLRVTRGGLLLPQLEEAMCSALDAGTLAVAVTSEMPSLPAPSPGGEAFIHTSTQTPAWCVPFDAGAGGEQRAEHLVASVANGTGGAQRAEHLVAWCAAALLDLHARGACGGPSGEGRGGSCCIWTGGAAGTGHEAAEHEAASVSSPLLLPPPQPLVRLPARLVAYARDAGDLGLMRATRVALQRATFTSIGLCG